jgi:hypothetical protein
MDDLSRIERLSQLDLSNLRIEDHGLPMHVAALMLVDQAGPCGKLDLDALRVAVDQNPALQASRARGRFCIVPAGLGPPIWIDDPGFNVRDRAALRCVPLATSTRC